MLMDKHFDAERVVRTIEEICAVSEFVAPYTSASSIALDISGYLRRGKRRLTVVSEQFDQLGYRTIKQKFVFRGSTAANAWFARGKLSDAKILLVGHHDYCAGVGAEDNAAALAVMLELGRCLKEDEARIVFASFDLEELDLVGSRRFVATPSMRQLQELSGVIALECLGSGRDVVICREVCGAKSDPLLVSQLQRSAKKLGHRVFLESFPWFNADHVPFAEQGIRTVEVCSFNSKNYRGGPGPDVNVAHSSLDMLESIRVATLQVIGEILVQFVDDFLRLGYKV